MARRERVEEAIKQEVSSILQREMNDPRIGFVTVNKVQVSDDLKFARIFVSELKQEDKKSETFVALKKAAGFIQRLIGQRLKLRFTPEIVFQEDTSTEYSIYIAQKIEEIKHEPKKD